MQRLLRKLMPPNKTITSNANLNANIGERVLSFNYVFDNLTIWVEVVNPVDGTY